MLDVAVHHVVLRLDDRHRMQAAFRDDALGALEAGGAPFLGDAVVQDLALVDQVAQRLQGLLHRRGRIEAVAVIQVDVIHAEILQAPLAVGQDVLAGQAVLVRARAGREEHLAGDHDLVARILLEHTAEEDLGVAARVGVGAVEEVDAGLPRLTYDLRRVLHGGRVLQPGHPAAQRDFADLDAGLADVAILHVWFLSHAGIRSARSSSSSQCPLRYPAIVPITIVHRLPFFNPPPDQPSPSEQRETRRREPPGEREERRRVQLWGSTGTSSPAVTADMTYVTVYCLEEVPRFPQNFLRGMWQECEDQTTLATLCNSPAFNS